MRTLRTLARFTGSDGVQAVVYGGLLLTLDGWLLSHVAEADGRLLGMLAALLGTGAVIGVALGELSRRRSAPREPWRAARLARCAPTGGLFIHLVLPLVILVDVVLHPDHLIGYLGGTVDRAVRSCAGTPG